MLRTLALLACSCALLSAAQHFTFNNGAEPETLDPALALGVSEHRITDALFEGLCTLHPETLAPQPGVAESWTISDDGLVYTFSLRADAKWSNNEPVTAHDFVASWRRVLSPETGAEYAYQLFPIKNAEAFLKKEVEWDAVGVSASDDRSLVVTLGQPTPYFLDLCAFGTLAPTPQAVIRQAGDRWTRPEHIIGNGAFVLTEWEPREHLVLVPNEHYWDRANVKLERITIYPWDDTETAYLRFQAGATHWQPAVPASQIEEARRHPDYYVLPYLGTYFYRFNCTEPPFDDKRVRKALSLAIDRSQITEHILKAGQIPATFFCPAGTGSPGYTPVAGLTPDPIAARKLLSEAGYSDPSAFPAVELLYNNSESHKKVAENVAQQWHQALGITVKLRNLEWQVYLKKMTDRDYQVMRSGWIGDYNDPNTFFDMFVTNGGNNRTGWSNATYDDLLKQTQNERDPQARLKLFQDMERLLVEDELPIMPLYIYVNQGLLSEDVDGWYPNVRDWHPLKHLSIYTEE